ncbi:AraC family transcriptional regulator [Candidatus Galacturonibacter soehngenii]|uniref:AraC family transcriptional regulator n=1 Tax=Candidatus Galacturonatibacter soehngenii TaxID=2307010 RepID=A0A7V7QMD3_9FIRM|nr:AraC family transcriptional regulator [Candidatus Galacturonibacter soehngenii]KAB1439825.1 AraC family transcriptional regulator [Candidatus Galacturonibacter soehngenii]
MGLSHCGLNLNRENKELQPHGSAEFPCAGYKAEYFDNPQDSIPWHWHEEIEIAFVKKGALKLKIPTKSFDLKEGDCIAINSNVLHYAIAQPKCELHSFVFSPLLITGNDTSVFATKYVKPLINCSSFDGYVFSEQDFVIESFVRAFNALASDVTGYEFIVRDNLSFLCFTLYEYFKQEIGVKEEVKNQDNIRIRKMLDFLHEHFTERLTLAEVAKVADIGERECLRCFQRTIQLSPMQYLLKYRVMQAATLLQKDSTKNIIEIASICGFDSTSNFSKMFKRFYNCTPREYRKRNE